MIPHTAHREPDALDVALSFLTDPPVSASVVRSFEHHAAEALALVAEPVERRLRHGLEILGALSALAAGFLIEAHLLAVEVTRR